MKKRGRSPAKKSKTFIDKAGYRRFRDSGTAVHRWVAKTKLRRELKSGEVVHHKNRDKLDNSPSNLRVLPNQSEHYKLHKRAGY